MTTLVDWLMLQIIRMLLACSNHVMHVTDPFLKFTKTRSRILYILHEITCYLTDFPVLAMRISFVELGYGTLIALMPNLN